MNIGLAIKTERKRQKLTHVDICATTGLSRSAMSLIETGKKVPYKSTVELIAQALNVSVAYIYVCAIGVEDIWRNDPEDPRIIKLMESGIELLKEAL